MDRHGEQRPKQWLMTCAADSYQARTAHARGDTATPIDDRVTPCCDGQHGVSAASWAGHDVTARGVRPGPAGRGQCAARMAPPQLDPVALIEVVSEGRALEELSCSSSTRLRASGDVLDRGGGRSTSGWGSLAITSPALAAAARGTDELGPGLARCLWTGRGWPIGSITGSRRQPRAGRHGR